VSKRPPQKTRKERRAARGPAGASPFDGLDPQIRGFLEPRVAALAEARSEHPNATARLLLDNAEALASAAAQPRHDEAWASIRARVEALPHVSKRKLGGPVVRLAADLGATFCLDGWQPLDEVHPDFDGPPSLLVSGVCVLADEAPELRRSRPFVLQASSDGKAILATMQQMERATSGEAVEVFAIHTAVAGNL
jgi:hypothetical protein